MHVVHCTYILQTDTCTTEKEADIYVKLRKLSSKSERDFPSNGHLHIGGKSNGYCLSVFFAVSCGCLNSWPLAK